MSPLAGRSHFCSHNGVSGALRGAAPARCKDLTCASNADLKCSLWSLPHPHLRSPNKKLCKRTQNDTYCLLFLPFSMPETQKDCVSKMLKNASTQNCTAHATVCSVLGRPTHFSPRTALGAPRNPAPGRERSKARAEPGFWPPPSNANSRGRKVHRAKKTKQTSQTS